MRFPGFIGPSHTLSSPNLDRQRTVNLYPEINELGTGKEREVAALIPTPGLTELLELPTSPLRATYTDSTGQLFAVGGNKLYTVDSLWAETEIGTLSTNVGPVSFADNGEHVILVDGDYGYTWTIDTSTFAAISDEDFLGADHVAFLDGYFIFNKPGTGQFQYTGLYDTSLDGADFATAEGSPDLLLGLITDHQNLYLFGTQSTEVFYNSGDSDNPLQRTQGALMDVGLAAKHSLAIASGQIMWVGRDKMGRGIIYSAQGYQPKRISTHAIEKVISDLGDITEARAFTYQQSGHVFYCLNLPGAETTWVYDLSTQLWHERAYLTLGEYQRHRADCHAFAYETNVVGDYVSGKLYKLDQSAYSDDGNPIVWERSAPHVSKNGVLLFHSRFLLDMETGVGLSSGQGSDPQVMLQYSDDGGHTWSNERWKSCGAQGARKTRVYWDRLGSSRDRVYRVRGSDPVKRVLIGAEIEFQEGTA